MGLEEVREEVLRDAEREAAKLQREAEKEAFVILQQARDKIKEYEKKTAVEIERNRELLKRKEITQATLDVRNKRMNAKKEAIEAAFEKAREKIVAAPRKKKEAMLQTLLKRAEKEIDIGTVFCHKRDARLVKHRNVKEMPRDGIMAETKDGSIRVDYCFDTLLQKLKEEKLAEIAQQLFG